MMQVLKVPTRERSPRVAVKRRVDMSAVSTLILGGGAGKRLYPLTLSRCKPAVSFGGRYRLIDIPMSNALNSGCEKLYVITQFLSASLHKHLLKTYRMAGHSSGFVEILSPEQKPRGNNWYLGTADAVRQNLEYLKQDSEYILILSGDQLYQMDYEKMVLLAEETNADLVIASLPVDEASARHMGIFKVDEGNEIIRFVEKPQTRADLESLITYGSHSKPYLGSMGIYLFKRKVLFDLLEEDSRSDFGKHLIPRQVAKGNVIAYLHSGYWEDIGTLRSFYDANIDLAAECPAFNLFDETFPIYTEPLSLPPPKILGTEIKASLICEGSTVAAESICQSIVGPRSRIGKGTIIDQTYLFGNDRENNNKPSHLIGEGCEIRKAIIDKEVRIGNGVKLINQRGLDSYESDTIVIKDGIIIVLRGAVIPDHFIL